MSSPAIIDAPASRLPPGSALQRLEQLQRALQRKLRRKATEYERTQLERTALLMLRPEIAARDPNASSNDIVRLANAARRAEADFERIATPLPKPDKDERTLDQMLGRRA